MLALTMVAGWYGSTFSHGSSQSPVRLAIDPYKNLAPDLPSTFIDSMRAELVNTIESEPSHLLEIVSSQSSSSEIRLAVSVSKGPDSIRVLLDFKDGETNKSITNTSQDFKSNPASVIPQQSAFFIRQNVDCISDFLKEQNRAGTMGFLRDIVVFCTASGAIPRLELARKLTTNLPQNPAAWAQRAVAAAGVYDDQKTPAIGQEVNSSAQQALKLDPVNSNAYWSMASLLPEKSYKNRIDLLSKSVLGPSSYCGCGFHLLGIAYVQTGQIEKAITNLSSAIDVTVGDPSVAQALSQAYTASDNFEQNEYIQRRYISLWPEIRFDRWLFKTLVAQGKFDQTLSLLDTLEMRSDYSESERNARIEAIKALKSKSSQDMQSASRTLETLSLSDSSNGTTVIQLLIMLGDIDAATAATVRYVKSEKTNFPELYSSKFAPLRHRPEIVQIFDQLGLIRYWKETRVKPDFCKTDSVAQLCNL